MDDDVFDADGGTGQVMTTVVDDETVTVVELHGDIDGEVVAPLQDYVTAGIEQGLDVLVDLAEVTLIDSASLDTLVGAGHRAARRGTGFCLVAVPPKVLLQLAGAGLDDVFLEFRGRLQAFDELSRERHTSA